MTTLMSTGKKKQRASRVFGDVVLNEVESSLCYSPSPGPAMLMQASTDDSDSNPTPTVLFETVRESISEKRESISEKRVSYVEDKENAAENTPLAGNDAVDKNSSLQSIRSSEFSRLRASAQSPQRRDLVKKTQAAIKNATSTVNQSLNGAAYKHTSKSVNESLNATRKAKEQALRERAKKTKNVRFQWDEEKTEAKSFYEKIEDQRRQILAVQRKLASAHFKVKATKDDEKRRKEIVELEQNYEFNSEVYIDHQRKLKEERDSKRKKSIDSRAKLRQNKREGEDKLQTMKKEEDEALFEIRYDLHRARNEAAKSNADERRKSFQFRAGDAKRIKEVRGQWRQEELQGEHEDFELKRGAAKDVEEYKKKMAGERRDSFKSRNLAARKRREEEKHQAHAAMIAEHESYDLKFAGERDTDEYRKRMAKERRKSLATRNKESARHAQVMQELRNIAQEKEAQSFMLKWAGENDTKEYIAKVAEERRKSLQFRGEEAKKQRIYEDEQHRKAVESALAEGALQSQCQEDLDDYKKENAERRRKSLQFRGKESKVQRLEEDSRRQKLQEVDEENFVLDSLGQMDVEEYIKDCKRLRRKSLAFRAKEKRRHAQWKRRQEEMETSERARTSHFQSLDAQHRALAKQKEHARIAMDALRSAGCSFTGNPFGDLLNL